jgi:hypothetical protein
MFVAQLLPPNNLLHATRLGSCPPSRRLLRRFARRSSYVAGLLVGPPPAERGGDLRLTGYQPLARQSGRLGRSVPRVVSLPWPG